MRGVNKIFLLGNVGKDPLITELKSGDLVASFPFATTEVWKKDEEQKEETTWHNIVCWKSIAKSVRDSELKKSDTVHIEGKVRNRKYIDKEGNEKHISEVIVDEFTITRRYLQPKELSNHEE